VTPDQLILFAARLAFVRRERAYERRARHGLPPRRGDFLSGVCAVLAGDVEAAGLEYLDMMLPAGEVHDFGVELVALAAAGLGYGGIAAHFDEICVVASRFAHARAEGSERWRDIDEANAIALTAYRTLFVPAWYSRTVGCWPRWLPESLARPCVALLHRRTGGRPLLQDQPDD
jgi:hypothetical protein